MNSPGPACFDGQFRNFFHRNLLRFRREEADAPAVESARGRNVAKCVVAAAGQPEVQPADRALDECGAIHHCSL